MRRTFPCFAVDVPEPWLDTSTVRFMIPNAVNDSRLLKSGPSTVGNVVLTWAPALGRTPESFLREQLDELKRLSRFKLMAHDMSSDYPSLDYTFRHDDKPLRQLMLVRAVGDNLVCVVGSARDAAFEGLRERFVSVARSVAEK